MTLALLPLLHGLLHGVREGLAMIWATAWALALGFTLSGMVQAFVSKSAMTSLLGTHSLKSLARATGLGAASSSCSYAASAMSRSLVARGADFTTAMVFLFSSTNLVIELGIVLVVLVGWTFMAAEFVGGLIMVLLLALLGSLVFTRRFEARVRDRLEEEFTDEPPVETERPWRTRAGWSDAATYALADVRMLKKELLIGYGVAGFLGALVPARVWSDLFLTHHGALSTIENALIGPVIACLSWVCSVGNVPLAAALWAGGISFGGVIAFIFADLVSFPLILVYRRFFGWRVALTMAGVFYVVMVAAALATQGLFALAHLTPSHPHALVLKSVGGGVTGLFNVLAVLLVAGLLWLALTRSRMGGGAGYAIDPVCGMQVRTSDAPARAHWRDETIYFCAPRCQTRFLELHPDALAGAGRAAHSPPTTKEDLVKDPVCQMEFTVAQAAAEREFEGKTYYFCALSCAEAFEASPRSYLASGMRVVDPVCRHEVALEEALGPATYDGVEYYFCNPGCRAAFEAAPDRFARTATVVDPVCHMNVEPSRAAAQREYQGTTYYFCALSCAQSFEASPETYLRPSDRGASHSSH